MILSTSYDIYSDTFNTIKNKDSMCTVTYNGNDVRFYLNGNSVLNTPYSLTGTLDSGTANATLGWGAKSANYYYKGKIYTYQVYNRSLSATEILQNYKASKSKYNLS